MLQAVNTGMGFLSLLGYSWYRGSFAVAFAPKMFCPVGTVQIHHETADGYVKLKGSIKCSETVISIPWMQQCGVGYSTGDFHVFQEA